MADAQKISGFGSLNAYRDVNRGVNVHTLSLGVTPAPDSVPLGFYGFIDGVGEKYWSEQKFKYRLCGPFDASLQMVSASALPNQKFRLGFILNVHEMPSLKEAFRSMGIFSMGLNFHLLEFDSEIALSRGAGNFRNGGQLESSIAGAVPGTSGRLFYEGWLDLDIDHVPNEGIQLTPVGDFLLGYSVLGNPTESGALRLVAEFRYNQVFKRLQDSSDELAKLPGLNPVGLEVGAGYFIKF